MKKLMVQLMLAMASLMAMAALNRLLGQNFSFRWYDPLCRSRVSEGDRGDRERGGGGGGGGRQTDRQTETDIQTDIQTDRQTDRDRQTDKQTDRYRQRQRQTNRKIDRWTD